jgi:quercetin dioxygenase-like cupin family protein
MKALNQALIAALLLAAAPVLAPALAPALADDKPTSAAQRVFSEKLPNVPGKTMTAVEVTFPPGAVGAPHRHAGSVFVYVLAGAVRSQLDDGPAKVYRAGETFFEPPGTHHMGSSSASATEPARILAVFVADDGATLTTYDK